MKRVAIFVDAGYLYAQGSACLQGSKAKRESLRLDHSAIMKVLRDYAVQVQPAASLLRIYWYDGTSRGPTLDHRMLADLDDVKLRLGFINSVGQQKGVDSLLVTDLVELSRNGAICDALLVGGDEDLRIGVQIAQSFGVRVHLVGIEPSRGSQSMQLRQETDTKHEISGAQVQGFLSMVTPTHSPVSIPNLPSAPETILFPIGLEPQVSANALDLSFDQAIDSVLQAIGEAGRLDLTLSLQSSSSVPGIYDRRVLATCRTVLGRDLSMDEKKMMRSRLILRMRAAS